MSAPATTPRPVCRECEKEIADARWHHSLGWVYVQTCSDCGETLCGAPACGESEQSDEYAYNRCTRCVVHRRDHRIAWADCDCSVAEAVAKERA
jgi:DNA-directed RNA polymerase subunit RPC12/RpoP